MGIHPGRNEVTVADHALGRTSKGKEQIAVTFADDSGDRIVWYGFFSEKAIETTEKALTAIGWNPTENGWRIEELNGTNRLVGNPASIVCEEDTYEGKTRLKVRWVNTPGGGALREVMTDDEAKAFGESLRKQNVSSYGAAKGRESAPDDDFNLDDIPF